MLPFSRDDFFAVFASYNSSVWPAQLLLYALAVVMVAVATRRSRHGGRTVSAGLGLLWIWTGVFYHWSQFTAINRPAWAFGALFVIQGSLFLANALGGHPLEVGRLRGWPGRSGGLLVAYALIVYPLLGLAGHPAREVPLLGVPCPTTIFTFGLLLWTARPLPRYLLVIPLSWALVGSTAVVLLGVVQDVGLLAAGLSGLALLRPSVRGRPATRNEASAGRSRATAVLAGGSLYFLVVFACGFVLGVGRTLWLVPRVGERWAELIETPVMLGVAYQAARWISRRFSLRTHRAGVRIGVGGVGLILLLATELALVLQLRALSVTQYLESRDPIAGSVYALSLLLFAAMPAFVSRGPEPE